VYAATSTRVNVRVDNNGDITGLPGEPLIPGQPITARIGAQQTAFAMIVGGGLDIKINKHVSFRPVGLDYYMTRLQNLRTQGDSRLMREI
jgi:hypothetical protein